MSKQFSEDEFKAHHAEVEAYRLTAIALCEKNPDELNNLVKRKKDGSVEVTHHHVLKGMYETYEKKFVKGTCNA